MRPGVAADFEATCVQLTHLSPRQGKKTAAAVRNVVRKLGFLCDLTGADEERNRHVRLFDDRSQGDEIIAISIIECQHQRGPFHIVASQHLDRLSERHDLVMLSQKLDVLEEIVRGNAHSMPAIAYEMVIKNRDWKVALKPAPPISGSYGGDP